MKTLNKLFNKKFTSKKGELVIETAISFLILAILVTAVFMVLSRAMSMTSASARRAKLSQESEVNPAILMDFANDEITTIEFRIGGATGTIITSHTVRFNVPCDDLTCKCDNFPRCPAIPCPDPDCCMCNSSVAFAPN
jgi:uncharacterized protein (UPF0333 family)